MKFSCVGDRQVGRKQGKRRVKDDFQVPPGKGWMVGPIDFIIAVTDK